MVEAEESEGCHGSSTRRRGWRENAYAAAVRLQASGKLRGGFALECAQSFHIQDYAIARTPQPPNQPSRYEGCLTKLQLAF